MRPTGCDEHFTNWVTGRGVQVWSATRAGEWMLVKSNFSRLCETAVCLCFFPLQPRCKKHLQHLLQEIQWSPLNTDLKCLQKIFFYISNVYSVCTRLWSLLQETVDIQNHFKIKENKHCWFCHSSASCTSFSNQTKLDYKETNSRDFDPDWKHVLQLTLTVFQPSAKGETEKTVAKNGGNVTNGGRKRGRTPPSLCEAPVMTCPNPPPPLGNVMWRV